MPGNNPDLGAPIQMWSCNGTPAQLFTRPGDGTLRALDRCLQLDGTADDSTMHLVACNGGPAQQFDLNAAQDLVSVQTDRCVEVPGANRGVGVLIRIQVCSGTAQQKWSLG